MLEAVYAEKKLQELGVPNLVTHAHVTPTQLQYAAAVAGLAWRRRDPARSLKELAVCDDDRHFVLETKAEDAEFAKFETKAEDAEFAKGCRDWCWAT